MASLRPRSIDGSTAPEGPERPTRGARPADFSVNQSSLKSNVFRYSLSGTPTAIG